MSLALDRCPCCRARLEPDAPDDIPCRRCGASLLLLHHLHRHADATHQKAQRAIAQDRPLDALRLAAQALALVDATPTRQTFCAALALTGFHDQALRLMEAWRLSPPPP